MADDSLEVNFGPMGYETLTRYNTALFTFLGETAMEGPLNVFNHVFIHHEETETEPEYAFYVFKDSEHYEGIREHIVNHNFPQHLNLTFVSRVDRQAFDFTHGIDANETTFPEQWANPANNRPPDPNSYDLEDDEEDET